MKHIKSYKTWVEESNKSKSQKENIAFWAGEEPPADSDDPQVDRMRGMFRGLPVKGSNALSRNKSYI